MSVIENDTPAEWEPFDTILCNNIACRERRKERYLYLGIGPYVSEYGRRSRDGENVELLLVIDGPPGTTWSYGEYMMNNFHVYDRETCG